jgi:hypothetical protein
MREITEKTQIELFETFMNKVYKYRSDSSTAEYPKTIVMHPIEANALKEHLGQKFEDKHIMRIRLLESADCYPGEMIIN